MNNLNDRIVDSMYGSLPKIFRDTDKDQNYLLRRLIEVCVEGGFIPYLEDVDKLYHKYDSSQWSKEDIKKFAKDFGWEFDERLDIEYQRRLVSHMMELFKIRGTKPCINYVANDMTGYDCTIIENYEGNLNEVGIKLHANEDDILPNFYTRSSIGFFLPFYCVPLLIIYYNFFWNEPLEKYKHEISNTIYFSPNSSPWELNLISFAHYNGEYKFDGSISNIGGVGGAGPLHATEYYLEKTLSEHIGSKEVVLSNVTYDGYFNYDGSTLYNSYIDTKQVICIHDTMCGILKEVESSHIEPQHNIVIEGFNLYTFNGSIKYDGSIKFSGEKLNQSTEI